MWSGIVRLYLSGNKNRITHAVSMVLYESVDCGLSGAYGAVNESVHAYVANYVYVTISYII